MLFENLREADQKHVRPQAPRGTIQKAQVLGVYELGLQEFKRFKRL